MAALTNSDPVTDKPPRRRQWIPLSLRMFLAILLLLGVGGLWLGARDIARWLRSRDLKQAGGELSTKRAVRMAARTGWR